MPYNENFISNENYESNALKSLVKTNYNLNFQNKFEKKIQNNSLDEKKLYLNASRRFLPINKIKNEGYMVKRPKTGRVRKMSMVGKSKVKRRGRKDAKSSKKISKFGKEMKYFTNASQSKKK